MEDYTVQIVEHVNHVAFVKASSQEEADKLAAENVNDYDWTRMIGGNVCEVVLPDDEYLDVADLLEEE